MDFQSSDTGLGLCLLQRPPSRDPVHRLGALSSGGTQVLTQPGTGQWGPGPRWEPNHGPKGQEAVASSSEIPFTTRFTVPLLSAFHMAPTRAEAGCSRDIIAGGTIMVAAGSISSREQGSCAELTSPVWNTVASSPSSARLSSKMQQLHLLCLILLVLGCVLDVHGGNNVLDCCLRTRETPIPRRIVQDYRVQLVEDGCNTPAAVFITTKGKRLCAPLQAPWVIRLIEKLDTSSARKAKPQGK
ncbi:uncharacterized protein LOC127395591 [Apus apus]|uniref:uncharacterized protein LOC127395591 n=1 Tax=Apus apus TaxID=8895 RepID=UPI0021F8B864|nr:uncharacterized protein LOC127395591 [Apus apus]